MTGGNMTQDVHQIDLNALPLPNDDELPFREHANHIKRVSTSQSVFQMEVFRHNSNYIDLNVLPSPNDDDDQPLDNTSYCQGALKQTQLKNQEADMGPKTSFWTIIFCL